MYFYVFHIALILPTNK